MIKHPQKATARVSLLLLFLSIVLLLSFCLTSVAAYAINNIENQEESGIVSDEEIKKNNDTNDNEENFIINESQESSSLVSVDNDHLIPEDPPIGESESAETIVEAQLQDKTGAPEIFDDGMFRYYLVDGAYYEVAGIYISCFAEIEIPSELFGIPVKGIQSYAFKQYKYLVSVAIPDSVEYIGDYAFHNCPNLISVTLPNNGIKIGEGVFQHSDKMELHYQD